MPQITAKLSYLRISPRKVRAVAGLLKGLDVDSAQAQLKYLARRPASPLLKLLDSAVANASHNSGLDKNYLYIKELTVNEGMKLKRYKPKGFGMAMPLQKKTSHIRIVLDELPEARKKKKEEMLGKMKTFEPAKITEEPKEKIKREVKAESKPAVKKPAFAKASADKEEARGKKKGTFGGIGSLGRRLFRRKSI